MPYLTLTLSGQAVDLPADAAVALSYRANDLRRLESREAAFSEQFTLPLTARNVAVLGAPHALDSQTLAPYRLLPAVLTSPGGTELLRGFGILEAAEQGYEITLTDAVGGLFAQVGDQPLRTLDLSAHDHTYALATTQAGQGREYTQGYAYVLADDGRLTQRAPAAGVLWYELLHAAYYHAVLTAIVAEALPGYRLTGSLLSDPRYRAAVLPRATPTPRLRAATLAPYAVQVLTTQAVREHDAGTGKYFPLVAFQQQLTGNATKWNGTAFATPPFPADIRVSARLLVRLDAEFVPNVALQRAVAAVRIVDSTDPAAVAVHEQIVYDGPLWPAIAGQQPPGLRAFDFDFTLPAHPANRRLSVQLRLENGAGLTVGAGSTLSFAVGPRTYPGAPVHLDASLPDATRADFLQLLFNQFNAVLQADANTKTARFDLFNDLEKRRGAAVDWSAKLDVQTRPRVAFRLGAYAQLNAYAYAPAPAAYAALMLGAPAPLGPGRGLLPVPNQTLPAAADAFTAEFVLPLPHPALQNAASLPWLPLVAEADPARPAQPYDPAAAYKGGAVAIYGGQGWRCVLVGVSATAPGTPPTLAPVPVVVTPNANPIPLVAWEPAPYAPLTDELATCALLVPAPAVPGLLVRADAPDPARFPLLRTLSRTGLEFDALLAAYHEGLRRALDPARLLTVALRLTPLDIAALDFARPVWLDVPHVPGYGQLKGLFYLNDIDQYQPANPAAVPVSLLALGDAVPGLAPPAAVPIAPPAGTLRRALLLESGAPLLLESGQPIYLES